MDRLTAITLITASALAMGGCAKSEDQPKNEETQLYFEAWISQKHPDATKTSLGAYILSDTPGTGKEITEDEPYIFVDYTIESLDGTISSTTDKDVAKRLGTYAASSYYGQRSWIYNPSLMYAGLLDGMAGMKIGGTRTMAIPGWLMSYEEYDTEAKYLKNETGTSYVYTVTLNDMTDNLLTWSVDSLGRYVSSTLGINPADSAMYGYYYVCTKEPTDTTTFPTDTTIYIDYTGRLLDGTVFDTTIKDTAKFYGIYSASTTYAPMEITMAEDYTDITMESTSSSSSSSASTTIEGFAYCLSKLRPYEQGTCAFYYPLGYSYSGSEPSIPPYASLRFDIYVVDEP